MTDMDCTSTRIPYRATGCFSKTVGDYIDQVSSLKDFFKYSPTLQGIKKAIADRKHFPYDRKGLVRELKKQYEIVTRQICFAVLSNLYCMKYFINKIKGSGKNIILMCRGKRKSSIKRQ